MAAVCERRREDRQRKGKNESFGAHVPGCIFPMLQVICWRNEDGAVL
jgi:hypothetical protein